LNETQYLVIFSKKMFIDRLLLNVSYAMDQINDDDTCLYIIDSRTTTNEQFTRNFLILLLIEFIFALLSIAFGACLSIAIARTGRLHFNSRILLIDLILSTIVGTCGLVITSGM
jgi:hypothetical protein